MEARVRRTDHRADAPRRHFGRLVARYDEVNRQIYRIESEEEPTTDEVLERLKKRRLKLKDDIAAMIAQMKRRM